MITSSHVDKYNQWRNDWCLFANEVLKVDIDDEQKAILRAVQTKKMVSVCSGTARGKDFISAVASLCFMYLTPKFNSEGELVENTKIALTAPTDRQVGNIMYPEIMRLWKRAGVLPGRSVARDIRTDYDEWFLTGFKASKDNEEAWTGFHAANTMFVVTEASGIEDVIWGAIEGNLQGNSRLLMVFNPNVHVGYAANSQRSPRFSKFRLDSLSSPNVIQKKTIIPGQVDYEWVKDKVESWCTTISEHEYNEDEGDFQFDIDGIVRWYRPNDLFRIKVRGMFPKASEDTLIPIHWVEKAMERWEHRIESMRNNNYGADVAGMGRDNSVICNRVDNYVYPFESYSGTDATAHMQFAGVIKNRLHNKLNSFAFIDTIGEGAGVYSRLAEQGINNALSCKYSENAKGLHDISGQYEFENMRAYLFWAVRDWLNPANKTGAMLPFDNELLQEATEIKWKFKSNGKVIIEPKADIKKRIGRSTDKFDSLANTFYPHRCTNEFSDKAYNDAEKYL